MAIITSDTKRIMALEEHLKRIDERLDKIEQDMHDTEVRIEEGDNLNARLLASNRKIISDLKVIHDLIVLKK